MIENRSSNSDDHLTLEDKQMIINVFEDYHKVSKTERNSEITKTNYDHIFDY